MQKINYGKHFVDISDVNAVKKTLLSSFLTQGTEVVNFENSLKKYFGSKFCIAVNSGTSALYLLALALNWKKNDYIITTPITFLATSNAILLNGATPVFVDVSKDIPNLNPLLVEKKIKQLKKEKKKIKAIIAVDMAGYPCDWKALKKISSKYKIDLINDNCHAMGSLYEGSKKYAIKYADYVSHSFHPVKNFTTGEGGAIHLKKKNIYKKILSIKNHGIQPKEFFHNKKPWYYKMNTFGYNFRMSDINCSLGSSQLLKLDKFINKRIAIAKAYDSFFRQYNFIKVLPSARNILCSYHLYPIRVNFNKLKEDKIFLFNYMKSKNINLQVHYIPVYKQPFYKKKFKIKKLTEAERYYKEALSLPIYYQLAKKEMKYILEQFRVFFNKYKK